MKSINRRYRKKYGGIITSHLYKNKREYTIGGIIFLIGIILGIIFVNNLNEAQFIEINTYIRSSILSIKENNNLNELTLLQETIKNNIIFVVLIWLMGSTVIGLLLVYILVCFKGYCFGFTISSVICVLGTSKGVVFSIITMLLKNIIAIPCTIALAVSGMNLYKSVMNDRRKENIKIEVIRHTLFSIFILILLIFSSIIEIYVSQNILKHLINWF